MTSASSSTAFNGFLAAYLQDREADCVRPLVEYLTRFPGDELRIAAEYVALQRTNEVTQLTPSGPGVAAVGSSSQRIDRYVILRELGRGGQGVVYLADDTRLRRKVALKVLTALGGASPELLKRFWREAEVTSMLDHPGICPVYDTGIENGLPYIAMRYVPGQTLAQMITGARGSGDQSRASVIHLPPPGATAGPRSERVGSVPQRGPSGWIEICRVLALVEAITHDPFGGLGKPEPLKYLGSGVWSRRIDQEHRLVYVVGSDRIDFLTARGHY